MQFVKFIDREIEFFLIAVKLEFKLEKI